MISLAVSLCLVLLGVAPGHGQTSPDCRKAEIIFQALCPSSTSVQSPALTIQGAPGKRGASGPKGDVGVGVQGPPGVVDYGRVDSAIDRKLEQVFAEQNAKIAELTTALTGSEQKIRTLEARQGLWGIEYDGKFFWLEILHGAPAINYEQGRQICEAQGGNPANVYSSEHMDKLARYMRARMPGSANCFVWTGMRIDIANRRATLRNGSPIPFVPKWFTGRASPLWRSDLPNIGMDSPNPGTNPYLVDHGGTRLGVLCEL